MKHHSDYEYKSRTIKIKWNGAILRFKNLLTFPQLGKKSGLTDGSWTEPGRWIGLALLDHDH